MSSVGFDQLLDLCYILAIAIVHIYRHSFVMELVVGPRLEDLSHSAPSQIGVSCTWIEPKLAHS
jgi:hypothetical protein